MDDPISRRPVPLPDMPPARQDEPAAPSPTKLTLYDSQLAATARVMEKGRELALMGWAV